MRDPDFSSYRCVHMCMITTASHQCHSQLSCSGRTNGHVSYRRLLSACTSRTAQRGRRTAQRGRRTSPHRHSSSSSLHREPCLSSPLLHSVSLRSGRPSRHCFVLVSVSSDCPVLSLLSVLHLSCPCRCLSFSLPSLLPSPMLRNRVAVVVVAGAVLE